MADIVPFESNTLPSYLANTGDDGNSDLMVYAGHSFPVMSIKGKIFTLVKDGERRVVPNPRDPESPATSITIALLKVSPKKSKTYYANGYSENAEDNKPTCFSNDGEYPDPSVANPQCKSCKACKWNAFGTARGADGSIGKGKACSDFVRIAIADRTNLEEPILMRVPPASIKALGEYGKILSHRHVPYQAVATRISFDVKQATPRLVFTPAGFVDEADYRKAVEMSKSMEVANMIEGITRDDDSAAGDDGLPAETPAYLKEETAEPATAPAPKSAPAKKAAPKAAPKAEAKPAPKAEPAPAENAVDQAADSIIEAAMGPAEAAPASAPAAAKTVSADDDLGSVLDNLGFE
jgi:hypothetical protein